MRDAGGVRRSAYDVGVRTAPFLVVRCGGTDCPVCGLGDAFTRAEHYDTCARCGWVDDPDANARPDVKSETNESSLNDAILNWPAVLIDSLSKGPLSRFEIVHRDVTSADTITSWTVRRFARCSTAHGGS